MEDAAVELMENVANNERHKNSEFKSSHISVQLLTWLRRKRNSSILFQVQVESMRGAMLNLLHLS